MNKKGLMAIVAVVVLVAGGYTAYFATQKIAQTQIDAVVAEISTADMKITYEDFKYKPFQNVLDVHGVKIRHPAGHHKVKTITVKGANLKVAERVHNPDYYENRDKLSFSKIADSVTFKNYENGKQTIDSIVVNEPAIRQFDIVPTNENLESLTEMQTFAMLAKVIRIPSIELTGVKGKAFDDSVEKIFVANLSGDGIGAIKVSNGTIYNNFGGKVSYKKFSINGIEYKSIIKMLSENSTDMKMLDSIGGAKLDELEFMAPDNSTILINSVELKKVDFAQGFPEQINLSAKNISPQIKTLDDKSKAMFSLLGYDELSLDFDMNMHTKKSDGKFLFAMDEVSLQGENFGQMSLGFKVTGDVDARNSHQLIPNSNSVAIGGFKVKFIDDSLVSRFYSMYAQSTGMSETAIKQNILTSLNKMFDENRYLAGYRQSVIDFMTNPEAIEITAIPSKPAFIKDLITSAMKKKFSTIVRMLRVAVVSNSNVSR